MYYVLRTWFINMSISYTMPLNVSTKRLCGHNARSIWQIEQQFCFDLWNEILIEVGTLVPNLNMFGRGSMTKLKSLSGGKLIVGVEIRTRNHLNRDLRPRLPPVDMFLCLQLWCFTILEFYIGKKFKKSVSYGFFPTFPRSSSISPKRIVES